MASLSGSLIDINNGRGSFGRLHGEGHWIYLIRVVLEPMNLILHFTITSCLDLAVCLFGRLNTNWSAENDKSCGTPARLCFTDLTMSFCKHTAWLRVWKRGDRVTLEASDRTGRLLHHVRQEEPIGVVVFIGHQRKYGALSSLQLRSRSARARKSHGEIHLDVAHILHNQQMLIVDGDIPEHGQLLRTQGAFSCHEVASKQYTAAPPLAASVSDSIYHRALFPLTDVVCLFAEDIGGLDCALQHLSAWNGHGPSSTARISPALLLVVDRGQEAKAKAKLRAEKLQRPHGWFLMIRVVSIDREAHRSSNRRQAKSYRPLSMEISRLIRSAQAQRRRESLLFSARHVLEFLRIAAARAVEERWTPLDFVKASRLFHQVEENIESHLLNLVSQFEHQDDVTDIAAPLVASSFLLNHYVPDMHGTCTLKLRPSSLRPNRLWSGCLRGTDFDPTAVFGSLYQKSCENVARPIAAHRDEAGLLPMATDLPSSWRTRTKGAVCLHRKIRALAASSAAPNIASLAATGYARYACEYFMTNFRTNRGCTASTPASYAGLPLISTASASNPTPQIRAC
ncbi:hypothetical protein IF1G_11429 [Cordyceps javanica]|uniref:Uncharacterized protein n=1 Tax=Cordyceps javanica TaxID=43265 RepID=A0A545UKB5_9HYPO|nr:hypothetical protein IF1G_11429 [Cordyceps javanica]